MNAIADPSQLANPLYRRARAATDAELASIPWLTDLDAATRMRAAAAIRVGEAAAGDMLCRVGRPVTYWFGLLDGLLKMSNDDSTGAAMTYMGVAPGGWFGEGTVLKHEPYRYNIVALRPSVVAGIPVETFDWLLSHSIAFNRFVMNQLNERLGQFIGALETDRLTSPEQRVARSLAAMFNPRLYPNVRQTLRITQHELASLAGLSRQRVNEALKVLEQRQLIRLIYGGVQVLDLTQLRLAEPGN
jgi:CRP/FNR family transcriptional regulator, cyclic AMP receptor protein